MNVRHFDWRDLSTLHRLRSQSVYLNGALLHTRGPLMVPGALFSFLAPSMGIFTYVLNGEEASDSPVFGQFIHMMGSPLSHLTFLTPDNALDSTTVYSLMEHMMAQSGERGALRLLADVDESSEAFETLRHSGFAIYSRQRIWQLTGFPDGDSQPGTWRSAISPDEPPIRSLYNNLVPALVQQVEPLSTQRPKGMVYYDHGELIAFVELKYGHRGIWAQPFVHPDAQDMAQHFIDLLSRVPNRRSRPVYICVRSYQAWLETAIEDLGAEAGPRQAVMAKQFVSQQKASRAFAIPALEGGQPEITAPIARLGNK
ncbi:MAG: hypothetical protein A2W35_17830 [Chloroflexi bacterium RBG_16_57_11]|nr:MAG: hypothetical protein A2W35_17830 [Chloroflexi bacterium RBG_16_57_11]